MSKKSNSLMQSVKGYTSKLSKSPTQVLLGEAIGTMLLAGTVLASMHELFAPLYVGLAVAGAVLMVGTASGAHLNPAVTLGVWMMKKVKGVDVPVYLAGQLLGALTAGALYAAMSQESLPSLQLVHSGSVSWEVLSIEVVATAVLVIGVLMSVSKKDTPQVLVATGVGLSLVTAVVLGTGLYNTLLEQEATAYQTQLQTSALSGQDTPEAPYVVKQTGVTLNPAVAMVSPQLTDTQVTAASMGMNNATGVDEKVVSRLNLESLLGTMLGGALGAALATTLSTPEKEKKHKK